MAGMLVKVIKIALQSVPGGVGGHSGWRDPVWGWRPNFFGVCPSATASRGPEMTKDLIRPEYLVVYLLWLQRRVLSPIFK